MRHCVIRASRWSCNTFVPGITTSPNRCRFWLVAGRIAFRELLQVVASAESSARAFDDDDVHAIVPAGSIHGLPQVAPGRERDCVQTLRPVERDPGDAVGRETAQSDSPDHWPASVQWLPPSVTRGQSASDPRVGG